MLKSFLRIAWRNLLKHGTSSAINIGGLAIGLATSILVLLFVLNEFGYDRFHQHVADLYLLMKNQQEADGVSTGRASAGPIGAALKKSFPEVVNSARVAGTSTVARIGDKTVELDGIFADTAFFSMMTFPAVIGDPGAVLRGGSGLILTETAAKKLFGAAGIAMGKTLVVDDTVAVRVEAIVKDPPVNSTIRFGFVRAFGMFEARNSWLRKWDDNRIETWLLLKPGTDLASFGRKATAMLQARSNDTTVSTFAMPMARLRLHSGFRNGKQSGGKIYQVSLVATLGFFVLLIACINFMNIATARSQVRAREVGVRKVLGASRVKVMMQFFAEALSITLLSLLAGTIICWLVIPVFNREMNADIHFDLLNGRVWAGIAAIGLLTGLLSGSYPALYLSRFRPASVLKGQGTTGPKKALLRRILVGSQFWVAILLIIGTIVVWQEIRYIENRPLGYEQENLIDVRASAELGAKYPVFRAQVAKIPGIRAVSAGSDNLVGYGAAVTGMDWPGKVPGHEISIIVTSVGYDWVKTAGLQLASGRDFDPAYGTDTAGCLVNEATVRRLGLREPVIGQKLGGSPIIGVVKDFVYNNPSGIIAPMAIYLYKGTPGAGHFFLRVANNEHWRETIAAVGSIVKQLDPRHGFDYSFTKEDYQRRFEEFNSYGVLATVFGGMAVFISCLGLFGLAGFLIERRAKEMSIRKVFGATTREVLFLLSADFLRPVFFAFLLAIPAAVWALGLWLNQISYHVSLSWMVFAAGGMIAGVIALGTVAMQGLRTATASPAKNLRNE